MVAEGISVAHKPILIMCKCTQLINPLARSLLRWGHRQVIPNLTLEVEAVVNLDRETCAEASLIASRTLQLSQHELQHLVATSIASSHQPILVDMGQLALDVPLSLLCVVAPSWLGTFILCILHHARCDNLALTLILDRTIVSLLLRLCLLCDESLGLCLRTTPGYRMQAREPIGQRQTHPDKLRLPQNYLSGEPHNGTSH